MCGSASLKPTYRGRDVNCGKHSSEMRLSFSLFYSRAPEPGLALGFELAHPLEREDAVGIALGVDSFSTHRWRVKSL
jgi:hypothetical protein